MDVRSFSCSRRSRRSMTEVANHSPPVVVETPDAKGPICFRPPPSSSKRKAHFLERTDPHFKRDLAISVGHVAYVTAQLTEALTHATIPSNLGSISLRQLETVCRETVSKRRAHSDKGDVEITWTRDGVPRTAILEVKQRKTPVFDALCNFPYDTIITDEKRLFDKIRARGDTIGYLLTNHDRQVFLFVSHDKVESSFVTHKANDRWKNRVRVYVDVPPAQFVEGTLACAQGIVDTLASFGVRTKSDHHAMKIKLAQEKTAELRQELQTIHKTSERLRRAIESEETTLRALCPNLDASSTGSAPPSVTG